MSTITITFSITDPGANTGRGQVNLLFTDPDGTAHNLFEKVVDGVPTNYEFQRVPWITGLESSLSFGQASNYANAFNRDYKHVGGTNNLKATLSGNVVTITGEGTFEAGSNYTGDMIGVTFGTPANTTPVVDPVLAASATSTGSCSVIEYELEASLGTGLYSLTRNGVVIQTGWDGSSQNVAMVRGAVSKIFVTDDDGLFSNAITLNVPRKLVANDFQVDIVLGVGGSDLTITNLVPVTGTTPVTYALVDTGDAASGYQSSNLFPGTPAGTYDLYIKDKFGCEVFRTIVVATVDVPVEDTDLRYFKVSDFNSLSFSKQDTKRKGYLNSLSWQENVGIRKQSLFRFSEDDNIQTQFKSSYPYHVITLFKCDGTKEALSFLQIQENIGVAEKVDCKLIPVDEGIGVYFDGGNKYTPGTTTVVDTSPYTSLPTWGEIGQIVTIEGVGIKEITGTGYDADLNKLYFTVDGTIASATDSKVQTTYNRHPYNVFRCDFPMTKVSNLAFVRIEAGYDVDGEVLIDQTWQSETIKVLSQQEIDGRQFIRAEWTGFKVLDGFIFDSSYKGIMWVKGRIRPFPVSESKTFDGSDRTYPLEQIARMGQKVTIPVMTPKQWNKFNLISGISIGGTLWIEDMELVRTGAVEAEDVGDTNFSNITAEFAYAGEGLSIESDEIVLNPSTGVEGSGLTGKEPVIGWTGFKRLRLDSGTYLRFEDGSFIALD